MKYQICVSGSSSGASVQQSHALAFALGRAIVARGQTLTTGAAIGLPYHAAQGAMSVSGKRGLSIGFSPAASFREHIVTYRLPVNEFDYINFTGMAYVGRDVYLVRSSDAVTTIGGRMGSLHEFSTALESRKVCGVLLGSGGLADYIPTLLKTIKVSGAKEVIYDTDPDGLVERVIAALNAKYADFEYDGTDNHVTRHRVRRG